jgi:hypothetical protein
LEGALWQDDERVDEATEEEDGVARERVDRRPEGLDR